MIEKKSNSCFIVLFSYVLMSKQVGLVFHFDTDE